MAGSMYIAETSKGYGVTTVFFVPAILRGVLVEAEKLEMKRVLCHSEKAAAYMADSNARASHGPGIAMAQSVGTANLAAGLQDAYLALSPVMATTGRWPPVYRYRYAYQEIDHWRLYEPVTKYNAFIDAIDQLPAVLCQVYREGNLGSTGAGSIGIAGIPRRDGCRL
jgi:acetolactate synthase-1/2/3 large subunit